MSLRRKNRLGLAGKIEHFDNHLIKGWAVDERSPDEPVVIDVLVGGRFVGQLTPSLFRWDLQRRGLGAGYHGFAYHVPAQYRDGGSYTLRLQFNRTGRELENSPVLISAAREDRLAPFATTDLTGNKVLALAPHPDDETLGCGGSLILHRLHGDDVKVLFLTDGAQSELQPDHGKEALASLREEEAKAACAALGVTDYEFWRLPDRGLVPDESSVNRLAGTLQSYKPTLVYAPSPFEFHADHRAAATLIWEAVRKTRRRMKLAFYENNRPLNINTLVDITPVTGQKARACGAYRSQLKNFPYDDCIFGLNRYRALTAPPSCDYAEGYVVVDSAEAVTHAPHVFALKQYLREREHDGAPPLVSIVVRTRDRLPLLRHALSSVLTQTYANLEVVVVNDGGEDVSSVIGEFADHLPIRHIRLGLSQGRAAAANAGAGAAQGKYINFLDDDDLLYPGHVEKLVAYLEGTGRQAAYSDCEVGSYEWDRNDFRLSGSRLVRASVDFDQTRLYLGNYIPLMTAMFTRRLWEQTGPFDEELEFLEDWDFWIRASEHTDMVRLPGVTAEYRLFPRPIPAPGDAEWQRMVLKIYRKHAGRLTPERLLKVQEALESTREQLTKQTALLERMTRPELKSILALCVLWAAGWSGKLLRPLAGRALKGYGPARRRYLQTLNTLLAPRSRK